MKKIYLNPTTEIVSVHLCGMLATSDPNVKVDQEETPIDAGLVESRRRNRTVWDDEEKQEEDF